MASGKPNQMVLLSRKGQTRYREVLPSQLSVKTHENVASGPSSSNSGFQQQQQSTNTRMSASVVLVNDEMQIVNFIQNYLCNENQSYAVIGAIGVQGTGKSTLLSMLAGNQTLDKYRQYIFRPCSRDTIYSGLYQTNGISVYITESRVIYIDCKPFNCSAIFEEQIRKVKSDSSNLSIYKNTQIEGLTLLGMMFELCDTVLFNIDWFIDVNAVQEVLRAALYSEFNFRKYSGYPKTTNLVVVHQRATASDFEMIMIKKRAQMLKSMFKDSGYDICGGISMANLGFTEYAGCESDVNYIVLDDLPQWSRDGVVENKLMGISYDATLKRLRPALQELKKHNFRVLNKLKPVRRRSRGKKLHLPPTLDSKHASRLKEENCEQSTSKRDDHERNNGNVDDDKQVQDFNPEHMPNITKWKSSQIPHEAWNENVGRFSVSALSPPQSNVEAFKSISLLLATHTRRNDYIELLLPPVDQPRQTELQWFEYARKVLEITKKAFSTKYFISNNGRVAPRLVRKLPNATKLLYIETKVTANASSRRNRRRGKKDTTEDSTKQNHLADKFNDDLNIVDKSAKPQYNDEEPANLDEQSMDTVNDLKEETFEAEEEDNSSSEFDETSSNNEESMNSSENSSSDDDENGKERNARRTRRRRGDSDAD